MRRFWFLLLAFLFPLQLFAGGLVPAASDAAATPVISVMHGKAEGNFVYIVASMNIADGDRTTCSNLSADNAVTSGNLDESQQPLDASQAQSDLEDQALPVALASLALDWQSFPHVYPHVPDGTSAYIGILRPPPLAVA